MQDFRAAGMATLLYLAALAGVASVAVAGGYAGVAGLTSLSEWSAIAPSAERTRLDQLVSDAREIRAALDKPLPGPEPLGPIVNKRAHAGPAKVVVTPKPKISREAHEAFAADWSQPRYNSAPSYRQYDRHAPQ